MTNAALSMLGGCIGTLIGIILAGRALAVLDPKAGVK